MSGANKAFYLLLGASGLVFIGLTFLLIKSTQLSIAHTIYICQQSLSNITFTLPKSIPACLAFFIMAIFLSGLLLLIHQILKTRWYIKKNLKKQIYAAKVVKTLISELNLVGKVDIIKDNQRFSFCYGIFKPRICLSTGLIKDLSSSELKAILFHESYHLKSYDPLKNVFAKVLSLTFFFIPTLKDVERFYTFSKEIAADDLVIKNHSKKPLLSALLKLIETNSPNLTGVAKFAGSNDLKRRLEYLTGKESNKFFIPSLRNIIFSLIIFVVPLFVVNSPTFAMSNMNEQSMKDAYFMCPYGDSCINDCKNTFQSSKVNYSQSKLYSSFGDNPK